MIRSSGAVVVRKCEGRWYYLFLRAYKNWDFPKGVGAPAEDPVETAKREVAEETGITDLRFPWGGVYKETAPYMSNKKKIARYYIAETDQCSVTFSINPGIGKPEHHAFRWSTYEEIMALSPKRLLPIIEWAHDLIEK